MEVSARWKLERDDKKETRVRRWRRACGDGKKRATMGRRSAAVKEMSTWRWRMERGDVEKHAAIRRRRVSDDGVGRRQWQGACDGGKEMCSSVHAAATT
ncbi:hypothetical protein AMTR_s00118p00088450 [Amborella trichopoda]|uniref:Uncharacterized protein n=1 Tax=Amborella trichopoda TaxID=13333 RepID=W1NQ26_AMBTC|nr:hypothetical protein AMTR_s00118p00088450 [Amborella trichopoda]